MYMFHCTYRWNLLICSSWEEGWPFTLWHLCYGIFVHIKLNIPHIAFILFCSQDSDIANRKWRLFPSPGLNGPFGWAETPEVYMIVLLCSVPWSPLREILQGRPWDLFLVGDMLSLSVSLQRIFWTLIWKWGRSNVNADLKNWFFWTWRGTNQAEIWLLACFSLYVPSLN